MVLTPLLLHLQTSTLGDQTNSLALIEVFHSEVTTTWKKAYSSPYSLTQQKANAQLLLIFQPTGSH